MVKKLPGNAGYIQEWVQSLGEEDSLEDGVANHSTGSGIAVTCDKSMLSLLKNHQNVLLGS